ncbi:hypothetical protein [Candidatus Enterococcus mansonii]|uniref:Uncharacterized protein n=1 Tax=Candidatus Enterococcus mansonii TaxID=1834181 RepID=A0A242CD17_9ENTE|nr:hypothetical protein [Enterococcus sp. 4G2_DIV0659]OTO08096.1 hypothetical protein A5880_002366 [Enterococcus sp. 4G2_DIV0659]
MKKRLLVMVVVLLGVGVTATKVNSAEINKFSETVVSSEESQKKALNVSEEKTDSLTVPIYELNDSELYQRFGYLDEQQIAEYFIGFDDTEKVVLLKNGGVLSGGMIDNSNNREVDSYTDPNGVTVEEIKALLRERQEALYQIRESGEVEVLEEGEF